MNKAECLVGYFGSCSGTLGLTVPAELYKGGCLPHHKRRIESEEPSTRRKSGHEPAPFGTTRTTWHYVAQDQPLHVVVGGCALSSEGVCILEFRPDLHRV